GGSVDDEGDAEQVALETSYDRPGKKISEQPAERLREKHHGAELDQEHARYLAIGEAEHAQARQLPRPLRELDAGGIVDDAECDDDRKRRIDAGHDRDVLFDRLAEA